MQIKIEKLLQNNKCKTTFLYTVFTVTAVFTSIPPQSLVTVNLNLVLYNQRKWDAKVNTKNLTHTHYMKIIKFS